VIAGAEVEGEMNGSASCAAGSLLPGLKGGEATAGGGWSRAAADAGLAIGS